MVIVGKRGLKVVGVGVRPWRPGRADGPRTEGHSRGPEERREELEHKMAAVTKDETKGRKAQQKEQRGDNRGGGPPGP